MQHRRTCRSFLLLLALASPGTHVRGDSAECADADRLSELFAAGENYGIKIVIDNPAFPIETRYGAIAGEPATAEELDRYINPSFRSLRSIRLT
jgi:hypothetical protein